MKICSLFARNRTARWPESDSDVDVPLIVRWPKNFRAPPQYQPGTENGDVIAIHAAFRKASRPR